MVTLVFSSGPKIGSAIGFYRDKLASCGMLFFSSQTPIRMPKAAGIPKSLLADVNKVKSRLATLEKSHTSLAKGKLGAIEKAQASLAKELKDSVRSLNDSLKKQAETIAQLGKMKTVKKEKRKPSEYNLFLKDKMSSGMSMIEAVKAWKEKEGGESPMRDTSSSYSSPSQQY